MSGSGNAKRKQAQQAQARKRADKSHARDREQTHTHLPKVGTKADQEHLHTQRQKDLVGFGRWNVSRGVSLAFVVIALGALVGVLALLVFTD